MNCSLSQLRSKEVINSRNGCRIGYVDDLEVNTRDARVCAIIIYGRFKFFGLLGRKDDCVNSMFFYFFGCLLAHFGECVGLLLAFGL